MDGASARIIGRELVYDGWFPFYRLRVEMPDGQLAERHLLMQDEGAAVLAYDPARRVAMLVSQPRSAVMNAGEAPVLEAIAGVADGAGPEERIRAEAMEEGGIQLGALEFVGRVWKIPAVSTERVMLYLAPYSAADRIAEGGGLAAEQEHITVHEVPLDALRQMVEQGEVQDVKTLALAQALMLRHPELWD
jgi:nudix-type nucleoside diphosphatase (YffH/AdpP family)